MCNISEIGIRIEQLRKERGFSRSEFARKIGVSSPQLGKIERGQHRILCETIINVGIVLDVSTDYILFGTEDAIASIAASIEGMTRTQAVLALSLIGRLADLVFSDNGNNALIQEALRRGKPQPLTYSYTQ
jgi:transcriptional regulator with XRE-family HTH domain